MRHTFLAPLALSLFLLPGCSTLSAISAVSTGSVASYAPDQVNLAKKALTAAHELHRGAADFLAVAASTNLCHAACAKEARVLLDKSEDILKAGDGLAVLGDAKGIEDKISAATALIGQVQSLIGKK